MSERESTTGDDHETDGPGGVTDDQLPEDLRPDEDNPLARHPEETGDDDDVIGGDREDEPETAPMTEEDADYGG